MGGVLVVFLGGEKGYERWILFYYFIVLFVVHVFLK